MDIKDIVNEGFLINEVKENLGDLAFISLRISLKAYFNTYKNLSYHLIDDHNIPEDEKDRYLTLPYIENACEAISHFHHFIELIIKDILRQKHILLATDASKQTIILNDLLEGKLVD